MKKMKIIKFVPIFVLFLLIGSSCNRTNIVAVEPACPNLSPCSVKLNSQFLGFCTKSFEGGSSKNMIVEISVDGFTTDKDNKTVTLNYIKSFEFPKSGETTTNDDALPQSPTNKAYPIDLPTCGSYAVTVLVRGQDGTCFKCCNNSTFVSPQGCSGTGSGNGTARFRVVSAQINSSLSALPPSELRLVPLPEKCSRCGC
jgi:hypothetical protein